MIDATNLSVDNKAVKWMTFNGSIVYSTSIDSSPVSLALENTTLSADGAAGWVTYTPPGDTATYQAMMYYTPQADFWSEGGGYQSLFPVSKHVFARAQHYNSTITNIFCAGTVFPVQTQENLLEWAKTNWTDQEYVSSVSACIADIELVTTSSDAFSEDSLPYYVDEMTFKGMFHRDIFKGLAGWCGTQQVDYAGKPQPIVFTNDIASGDTKGELQWSTPNMLSNLIPDGEQYDYIRQLGPTYLGTTGDSGKPIYITIGGGKNIVVSHNHQIVKPAFSPTAPYFMSGPNYTKAFPLLKAYVESKGDTIKTLEG